MLSAFFSHRAGRKSIKGKKRKEERIYTTETQRHRGRDEREGEYEEIEREKKI